MKPIIFLLLLLGSSMLVSSCYDPLAFLLMLADEDDTTLYTTPAIDGVQISVDTGSITTNEQCTITLEGALSSRYQNPHTSVWLKQQGDNPRKEYFYFTDSECNTPVRAHSYERIFSSKEKQSLDWHISLTIPQAGDYYLYVTISAEFADDGSHARTEKRYALTVTQPL